MATEGYDSIREMARDVRDANRSADAAKLLSIIAIIGAAIALALSVWAWNRANDAWGNAQRAIEITQGQ